MALLHSKANVHKPKKIFLASICGICIVAILLFLAIISLPNSINVSEDAAYGGKLSEGYMHDAETPTALKLKMGDFTYNSSNKSFSLEIKNNIGTSNSGIGTSNVSMTWTSKDMDEDRMFNKKTGNLAQPDGYGFSVERNEDFASYNAFGAVLNLELPQELIDLIASGTVTASASAKLSMRKTWNALGSGSFYFGIKSGTSLIKPNQQNITNWDNRPEANAYLSGFSLSSKNTCNDGDWGDTQANVSASGLKLSGKYLGIGVSGMANNWPGYSTPEARVTAIKITFTYSTTFKISADSNGSFQYTYYENATNSASGSATSGTVNASSSFTKTSNNPYAYVVIIPKNSKVGYQFKSFTVNGKTETAGYNSSGNDDPNAVNIASITSPGYTRTGGSYTYLKGAKDSTVNFTARTYKIEFRPNGGTGTAVQKTYTYDKTAQLPTATSLSLNHNTAFAGGWKYASDNASTLGLSSSSNKGKNYGENESFSNLFSNLTKNGLIISFDVVWVEAAATGDDIIFTASTYTELYSDVIYTISTTKTGYTLANVYATYTTGDLDGKKIALEHVSGNKWILYGICGNCTLSAEWEAIKYKITYHVDSTKGTLSNDDKVLNYYIYGVGISAMNLPTCTPKSGYLWSGWHTDDGKTSPYVYGSTSLDFSTKTGDIDLYAVFVSANKINQTINSTTLDNIAATATTVSGSGTASNYTTSGNQITSISAASSEEKMQIPAGIGWYFKNVNVSDSTNNFATLHVALNPTIARRLRAGRQISVTASMDATACAYVGKTAGDNCWSKVQIGIAQGFTSNELSNGSTVLTSGNAHDDKDDWWVNGKMVSTQEATFTSLSTSKITLSSSGYPGFSIQIKTNFQLSKPSISVYVAFVLIKNVKIKFDLGNSYFTYTLNGNGGTFIDPSSKASTDINTLLQYRPTSSNTTKLPVCPFEREGYEFIGWGTTSTQTSNLIAPGTNAAFNDEYFAIWKKKKFPVITYDVWTDETNYATTVRKEYYAEYGTTINLNTTSTATSYSGTNCYKKAGGGDYDGFSISGSDTGKITHTITSSGTENFNTPNYNYTSSIVKTAATSITSISKAIWGYFVWHLDKPDATITDTTVTYGTPVNLDDQAAPTHGATEKEFSYLWSDRNGHKQFYVDNEHVLYSVSESDEYSLVLSVTVTRGGIDLTQTQNIVDRCNVTINSISLVIESNEQNEFEYDGEEHKFQFGIAPDPDIYDESELPNLNSVLNYEQGNNEDNAARPYYYRAEGKNTVDTWKHGLFVNLVALGYKSYIGSERADLNSEDFYSCTIREGEALIKDAGTYWVSHITLLTNDKTGKSPNFVWTISGNENYQAPDGGAITATVNPYTGLKLYSMYFEKEFGKLDDTVAAPINAVPANDIFDINNIYPADNINKIRYLAISGMFESDYVLYGNKIAALLKREQTGLYQQAGAYETYMELIDLSFGTAVSETETKYDLAILNNYGIKLNALGATEAKSSAIKFYWVDKDGKVLNPDSPYDFTTPIETYGGKHKNFVITPKEIKITYNGTNNFIYNGHAQGPTNIITSNLLSGAGFEDPYGNLFKIFFYGIPLPENWSSLDDTARQDYIKTNNTPEKRKIVGDSTKNWVTAQANDNAISFTEVNAGKYGVAVVAAAYQEGENFIENTSFVIQNGYFDIEWIIAQKVITVTSQNTSTVFGDINYGGIGFNFDGIVSIDETINEIHYVRVDKITLTATHEGIMRYTDFTDGREIGNGETLTAYGSYAGKYTVNLTDVVTVGDTASTGMYGASYGNNYQLTSANKASGNTEIEMRTVSVNPWKYSPNANATTPTVTDIPASPETYIYGVEKGIILTLSNFYDPEFTTKDVSAIHVDANITAAELTDYTHISLDRTTTGTLDEKITKNDDGSITFVYTAVNAGKYSANIATISYTVGGEIKKNHKLPSAQAAEFEIAQKTINLIWYLDGTEITADGTNSSVIYDGAQHTITASFQYAADGVLSTTDNKVYYADSILSNGKCNSLYSTYVKGGTGTITNLTLSGNLKETSVAANENETYTVYADSLSGNYVISTDNDNVGNSVVWQIIRRKFSIGITDIGSVFVYDGKEKQIALNLVDEDSANDGKTVTAQITDFTVVTTGAGFTTNAVFNGNSKALSAINVGKYTLKYDSGTDGLKVETNWRLIGSCNYTGDNYLFCIIPKVLTFRFTTVTGTYNAQNQISNFYPVYSGDVATGEISYTYNLSEIIHAGVYTLTVTGATSENDNFCLASEDTTGKWYASIDEAYYTNAATIASYSGTITLDKYTIVLDTDSINEALKDFEYDGTEHGHTLDEIYNNYVKNTLFETDRDGYSLIGNAPVGKNRGNYVVSISDFSDYNGYCDYKFAREGGYTTTWSITRRPLTFVFTEYHSGGSDYSYDGNKHGYILTVSNLVNGESLTLSFNHSNTNLTSPIIIGYNNSTTIYGINAGDYSVTRFAIADCTVDGTTYLANNYSLPEAGADKSWSIVQKAITIEWKNTNLTYRQSEYAPDNGGAYAEITNAVEGDAITLTYGDAFKATNAGEYKISISHIGGASGQNYRIDGALSTTWKINAKTITQYSWSGDSSFTEYSVTYDGLSHKITATPTFGATDVNDGKVYDGDTVVFSYSSATGYTVSATVANTYKTKISGCNNLNYVAPNAEQEWTITRRILTVEYSYTYGEAITYCGAERGITVTVSGFVPSDYGAYLSFTVDTNAISNSATHADSTCTHILRAIDVGTYNVSIKIADNSTRGNCYTLSGTLSGTFEIIPLPVELTWKLCEHTGFEIPYDGKTHVLTATVNNLALQSDVVTVTVENGTARDAGSYSGKAVVLSNTNYTLENGKNLTRDFTVTPRNLESTWNSTIYVYNGQYQSDTFTINNLIAEDAVTFKISISTEKDGISTLLKTTSITKSGATSYTLSAVDMAATINAGTYHAVADGKVYNSDGTVNTNYCFTAVEYTTSYIISRATLVLSGSWEYSDGVNVGVYGTDTKLTYIAKPYTLTTTLDTDSLFTRQDTGVKDTVEIVYSDNVQTHAAETDYTAIAKSLSGAAANNYLLPTENKTLSYHIYPKELTLSWSGYENLIYNRQTQTVTASVQKGASTADDGKAYDSDTVVVSEYTGNTGKDADEYTATANALNNSDYIIASGSTLSWEILPLPVDLNWSFDTVQYDGTLKTVTATVTNLISGDNVKLDYKNNEFTAKGDYIAEVVALNNTNYTLTGGTNVSHDWKITPIQLIFSYTGHSDLVYNGENQGVTVTITNIASADLNDLTKLSYSVTASNQTVSITTNTTFTAKSVNAASYTVEITALTGTSKDNYVMPDNKTVTYSIAKRAIIVEWIAENCIYSKTEHSATANVTNVVGSDTVTLTYKTTANISNNTINGNTAVNADEYTTQIIAVSNTNYTITGSANLAKEWTISPKAITEIVFSLDGEVKTEVIYDNAPHTLTGAATDGAVNDDDGKIYTGDVVTFAYGGTVTENYGLSAITSNSATNAGKYIVAVSIADNTNYTVTNISAEFNIKKRDLTAATENVTKSAYVYDGSEQGIKITIGNIAENDNTSSKLYLSYGEFAGTVDLPIRNDNSFSSLFHAKTVGNYITDITLAGLSAANYSLNNITVSFSIKPKEITTQIGAEITTNKITYRAEEIKAEDLDITFNDLVTGETLDLGNDYTVTFDKSPIDVGTYTAQITLITESTASHNYELTGTKDFSFEIKPYEITPDMLSWSIDGTPVNIKELTYSNSNKTLIANTADAVFNKITGKQFGYIYFGFCNCGISASNPTEAGVHLDHQWLLDESNNFRVIGPKHAGSYCLVLTISGGDSDNFVLRRFDNYGTDYYTVEGGNTYLTWRDGSTKAIEKPLPILSDKVGALKFGIARSEQGATFESTADSLPFKGAYYSVDDGLPKVTQISENADLRVVINSIEYTYSDYTAAKLVRDAGMYNIRIYDKNSMTLEASGCDLFTTDAQVEFSVKLTVERSKITVTNTAESAWTKVYDKQTAYSYFTYSTSVSYTYETDEQGKIISTTDGVITGTTATISATYDNYNAGTRALKFTLSGADGKNYYLAFKESETAVVPLPESDYTVNGLEYTLTATKINPREITVAGDTNKVFDGTNEVNFDIVSSDVIAGDVVNIQGTYENKNVGTWTIFLTTGNTNYTISSDISAKGTIFPKPITIIWTNAAANYNYDGEQHGVSMTISGMVNGYEEAISYTGTNIPDGTIAATVNTAEFNAINANSYVVTLSLANNSNYTLESTDEMAEWSIAKRKLTIGWSTDTLADGNYIYGWNDFEVAYSNTERSVSAAIVSGVVEKDNGKVSIVMTDNRKTAVGNYVAIATINGDAASNYEIEANSQQTWAILQAEIEGVTLSDYIGIYNKTAQGVTVAQQTTQHSIPLNVTYSGGAASSSEHINGNNAQINVTTSPVTITATINANSNYKQLVLTATVTITPAEIESITLTNQTVTYDKQPHTITVNKTQTKYGDDVTVSYTINGSADFEAIDAGTYTVQATINGGDNYQVLERTATLTIEKADIDPNRITITADSGNIVYNTQYHGITITVENNQTQYGEPVTITYHGGEENKGKAKDVGTYSINAVIKAGNNYNDYTTASSTLTITPKQIALTLGSADYTYTGNAQSVSISFETDATTDTDNKVYTVDEDNVSIKLTYLGTSGAANGETIFKNAGIYTVSAQSTNPNYAPSNAEFEITVKKATIDGYYFVGRTVTYNGNIRCINVNKENAALNTQPMIKSVALLSSDVGSVSYSFNTVSADDPYVTDFNGAKNAGTYYVKAVIDGGDNYELWERKTTLIINKSEITSFVMNELRVTYDGAPHSVTVTVPEAQLINGKYYTRHGDEVTITYTISDSVTETNGNSAINVNVVNGEVKPYIVSAQLSFAEGLEGNYLAEDLKLSANLLISPASLGVITLKGGNFVYDSKGHNAQLKLPENTDYPQLTLNSENGQYVLTVICSEYMANNGVGDKFTVTYEIEGTSQTVAKDVGSYDFIVKVTPDDSIKNNYASITDLRSTVNITKADAADKNGKLFMQGENIFFNSQTATYDAKTHYLVISSDTSASILTDKLSDVITSLTIHPETNTAISDVATITYSVAGEAFDGAKDYGMYDIVAIVSHKNYNSFSLTATVTIEKADIGYYFNGNTIVYDMQTHYVAVSTTDEYSDMHNVTQIALKGDDVAAVSYTYTSTNNGSGVFNGATNVDIYSVTATITLLGDIKHNYNVWNNGGYTKTVDIEITKYETEVIWNGINSEYVYNGQIKSGITATFVAANGTSVGTMTITYLGTSGKANGETEFKNAGQYTVTASHSREHNYNFLNKTKQLEIKKADVTLYLVSNTVRYDSKTYYLSVNSVNAANMTDAPIESVTVYGETIPVIYKYSKNGTNAHDSFMDNGVMQELTVGARNAGTYAIEADIDLGEGESNFNDWADSKSATLVINKIVLKAESASNYTKVYDGTTDADCVISGLHDGNKGYITFTAHYADETVGVNKNIIVTEETVEGYEYLKANYTLPTITNGTITVRPVTLETDLAFWQRYYNGNDKSSLNPLTLTEENNAIAGDDVKINAYYNSKNVLEANAVRFVLFGEDAANYSVENLNFASQVDFTNGIYLIKPRSTEIVWSSNETTYNGLTQTVSAYITLIGDDIVNNGNNSQLYMQLNLLKIKDGNGNALSPEQTAVYRNAGTYRAEAIVNGTDYDENTLANYGITGTTTHEFLIKKATAAVNWSISTTAVFTYNGTDQGATVTATVGLLGDDVENYANIKYIESAFYKNGKKEDFRNAGNYNLIARFTDEPTVVELKENYELSNASNNLVMNRADITNLKFEGSTEWTYDGVTRYFFVNSASSATGYQTVSGYNADLSGINTQFYYEFDNDVEIAITYYNGDTTHSSVLGVNGITNAGKITISASVAQTENYNGWSGEINVDVAKGVIDNIVMRSYSVDYDGNAHGVYAYNSNIENPRDGEYSQIKLPDGRDTVITYHITVASYNNPNYTELYDKDVNYATNAGSYIVNAYLKNDRNYEDFEITDVILEIIPMQSAVIWEYDNRSNPDFTYNATNQMFDEKGETRIKARMMLAGSGTEISRRLYLNVTTVLLDELNIDEALKTVFVVAGQYRFTASFKEGADYELLCNNYTLTENTPEITMEKYTVNIKWYYSCSHKEGAEEYNPESPCIYDASEHSVRAEGRSFNNNAMNIIIEGTFAAVNAGDYTARVKELAEGTDKVTVNGTEYSIDFAINYKIANNQLSWSIAKRPVTIVPSADNNLTKIYDGTVNFSIGTPTKTHSEPDANHVISITMSYETTNLRADGTNSTFSYTINNVIINDVDAVSLPISAIIANKPNVNATEATVIFGQFGMGEYENYTIQSDISGIKQQNDNLITQRDITIAFSKSLSHVYNGKTYERTITVEDGIYSREKYIELFKEDLFVLMSGLAVISGLIDGNYLSGTVNIGNNTDIGTYSLTSADMITLDSENAQNYILKPVTGIYEIKQRSLAVDYKNVLQSFNQTPFKEIEAHVNLDESDHTDLVIADGQTEKEALNALLTNDGFTISVNNNWINETYTKYTRKDDLTVNISSDNYKVNVPVLQLTYIKLENEDSYSFTVETLNDLLNLDEDNYGLTVTRNDYSIGILPSYRQTADISGLVNGGYTVMNAIRDFHGNYDGENHRISHLDVIPSTYSAYIEYAALFGTISEGNIKNMNFTDINVYAKNYSITNASGFAGLITDATVENVSFNGNVYFNGKEGNEKELTIGGFVANTVNSTLKNISIAVKVNVYTSQCDNLYVGGFAGKADRTTYENIDVFDDTSVMLYGVTTESYYGAVIGYIVDNSITINNCRYLRSSVYVNDGNSAILRDSAFGNTETYASQACAYDDFVAGTGKISELITKNIIRSYLLPTAQNGTTANKIIITNYRQIALLVAYPYMNFTVSENISSPIALTTLNRGFSGTITYATDKTIRADIPSDINLFDAIRDSQQAIVIHMEKDDENKR